MGSLERKDEGGDDLRVEAPNVFDSLFWLDVSHSNCILVAECAIFVKLIWCWWKRAWVGGRGVGVSAQRACRYLQS